MTRARPSTASEPLERVVKRFETWQKLVGLVLIVAGAGATWATCAGRLATTADIDQVRVGAAAQLSSSTAGTTAQLAKLQAQTEELRGKMARLEGNLEILNSTTTRLFDQVIEVAKATGARQVPLAGPSASVPPPQPP